MAERAQAIDARDRENLVHNKNNDVNEVGRPWGNRAAYALRRLRRDRPDIHARVLAGELSPHAGMVEAGFRKKTVRKKLTRIGKAQRIVDQMTKAEFIDFKLWINRRK